MFFFSRQSNSWFVVFISANIQHCCCMAIIVFKWSSTGTSISKQVHSKWTNRHLSNWGAGWVHSMKYGFLTKCEIKMAGYWRSFFCVCLWTESKSWSINTQKSMRAISSHLDRTSLVNKGFIVWDKTPKHDIFSLGDKALSQVGKNF